MRDYGWTGEYVFWIWQALTPRPTAWLKNDITAYNTAGHPFRALGFGWCNDMATSDHISPGVDPVYGIHWYGRSAGGPDGDQEWGLDAGDYSVTGNRVSLETYLGAMEELIAHCATNSPSTKMIFTTGPVDIPAGEWTGECGYQGHLKHEAIRNYVKTNSTRILFDYADILCYDNDGTPATQTWNGYSYPVITATNLGDESIGHIGSDGAIRLAKAQWWLLARMAGWDGGTTIPVTSITVSGGTSITTDGGSFQMAAAVLPANATNKTVTWSITSGSAYATINSTTGVLTAVDNGTVTVRATATDGSNVYGSTNITITGGQVIPVPVTSITVTGTGGATAITTDGGSLQMVATVLPANATNKTVTWSITSGSAYGTINSTSGLLTAVDNGTVTVRATATDGSNVYGSTNITISGQTTPVSSITVYRPGRSNINHHRRKHTSDGCHGSSGQCHEQDCYLVNNKRISLCDNKFNIGTFDSC